MTFSRIFTAFLFLLISMTASTSATAGKLEAHDAWAREAPPNTTVMAGYLTLHNHSKKTYTLVSVTSADFKRVEIHRTEEQDGMTKMLPVSRVMLSTNGSVSFQPGGMHLMLMKPKKSLKAGDTIALNLIFSDESSLKVSLPIKKSSSKDKHQMDHSGHDSGHSSDHSSNHSSAHEEPSKKNSTDHHTSHTH